MLDKTVVALTARLDVDTRRLLAEAANRCSSQLVYWDGNGGLTDTQRASTSLIVATLEVGERKVPDYLSNAIAQTFPGLPVLLLCREPLVRTTITLHNGRINLVGLPLNTEKISNSISSILALNYGTADALQRKTAHGLMIREFRDLRWWAAAFWRPPETQTAEQSLNLVCHHAKGGFAACLKLRADAPERTRDVFDTLSSEAGTANVEAQLSEKLGDAWACVALNGSNPDWLIYAPAKNCAVWINSMQRIPYWWNATELLADSSICFRPMKGAPGDVLLAVSNISGGAPFALNEALSNAAMHGGFGILNYFESLSKEQTVDLAAAIVELR